MAQEPEHYVARPLPPHHGVGQGGRPGAFPPGSMAWGPDGPQPTSGTSSRGRSVLLAYVLWFFLGALGAHKFYLNQPYQGIIYILLTVIGWSTTPILIGWFILAAWGVLMIVDLVLIPVRLVQLNTRLLGKGDGD